MAEGFAIGTATICHKFISTLRTTICGRSQVTGRYDSYCENSYLADQFWQIYPPEMAIWGGRLVLIEFILWELICGRSTDRFLLMRTHEFWADQVADLQITPFMIGVDLPADLPDRILLWELISGRSGGRYPPEMAICNWVLIDSYYKNSYLADQVADLPPQKW